jgi:hypothetical protein
MRSFLVPRRVLEPVRQLEPGIGARTPIRSLNVQGAHPRHRWNGLHRSPSCRPVGRSEPTRHRRGAAQPLRCRAALAQSRAEPQIAGAAAGPFRLRLCRRRLPSAACRGSPLRAIADIAPVAPNERMYQRTLCGYATGAPSQALQAQRFTTVIAALRRRICRMPLGAL